MGLSIGELMKKGPKAAVKKPIIVITCTPSFKASVQDVAKKLHVPMTAFVRAAIADGIDIAVDLLRKQKGG